MGTTVLLYGLMLIPAIAVIFCAIRFPRRVNTLEAVIIFVVPLVAIIVVKILSVHSQTRDTEYWNSYGMTAIYYEPWSTYVEETCETCTESCTGSGSNEVCTETCVPYDCSYCDETGPEWVLSDNLGKTYPISESHFQALCKLWGNRNFRDMRRSIDRYGSCGVDGDAYVTSFDGVFEHTQPICKQYVYENRVQCSKSVFNFPDVDSADVSFYGLHRYPNYEAMGIFRYNPIVGENDKAASDRLSYHNAHLGSYKQVHMMILVYHDKPSDAGLMQENYWENGNKNEFILCIGRSEDRTDWTHVISWTEEEELKVRVARLAKDMDYDLVKISDMMAAEVRRDFVRKEFADFSYLTVEPTNMALIYAFLITLLSTVGIVVYAVLNRFERDRY